MECVGFCCNIIVYCFFLIVCCVVCVAFGLRLFVLLFVLDCLCLVRCCAVFGLRLRVFYCCLFFFCDVSFC